MSVRLVVFFQRADNPVVSHLRIHWEMREVRHHAEVAVAVLCVLNAGPPVEDRLAEGKVVLRGQCPVVSLHLRELMR